MTEDEVRVMNTLLNKVDTLQFELDYARGEISYLKNVVANKAKREPVAYRYRVEGWMDWHLRVRQPKWAYTEEADGYHIEELYRD
jgi:hypothetical protein